MYLVQKSFIDLQDGGHIYELGDEYPRKGYKPTEERIVELAGTNNKQGVELIKEVMSPKKRPGGKKASK